jgi:hypothetical protein
LCAIRFISRLESFEFQIWVEFKTVCKIENLFED